MARAKIFTQGGKTQKSRKKTSQGLGRGTKFSTKIGSKRFKRKRYRGQGK